MIRTNQKKRRLEDRKCSRRRAVVDDDRIETLIKNNPRHTSRDIEEMIRISHMSVVRRLKENGFLKLYDVWMFHDFTETYLMDRPSILLKRNKNDPLLERTIKGDEKQIVYNNGERNVSSGKVQNLFCIRRVKCWWVSEDIMYYQSLLQNPTLKLDNYFFLKVGSIKRSNR